MPSLFRVGGYLVFFWSNENGEPIHVHIAKGKPSPGATKIWLTRSGGCVVANNAGRIPQSDLNELMEIISAQFFLICRKWKEHFCVEEIQFFFCFPSEPKNRSGTAYRFDSFLVWEVFCV